MKILLIDNGTVYMKRLHQLLSKSMYDVVEKSKMDFDKLDLYNGIILSGSITHGVIEDTHVYMNEIKVIKESNIPIFGICLGFELMVYAYGGTLKKLPVKIQEIKYLTHNDDPIFDGISNLHVFGAHQRVVEMLPGNFIELATSDAGVEIIKHKDRLMYGTQFHPEAKMKITNGYIMIENFLKLVEVNMQR